MDGALSRTVFLMSNNRQTVFDALGRHPIHPFPARMAPGIALSALSSAEKPLRVLDPMMGSGTVLAMARAHGHYATGVDVDPLAVLLAQVWTTAADQEEIIDAGARALAGAKPIFDSLTYGSAYPPDCSAETRQFLRYWFDEYARRQLAALTIVIGRIRRRPIRDALWCAFSRLIITKSHGASLAMDLSHSRPHKAFHRAPMKPFDGFPAAVSLVAKNCVSAKAQNRGPRTTTMLGDARKLTTASSSFDLVLTSPPYLNAIDYIRCSKFSLVWMGHSIGELRDTRAASVGSEVSHEEALGDEAVRAVIHDLGLKPKLSSRNNGILSRYVWDMRDSLSEVSRVLKKGGDAVYVVGDSTVRGSFVRNSEIVRSVAELNGLTLVDRRSRNLPANRRYLPPPKKASLPAPLDTRMRREVILTFKK
ncbi:DNA modification methylase [Bradyrhizobium sp. GM24.11]